MERDARIALVLVCGAILAVSIQYIFIKFDGLISGNIALWSLQTEQLEGIGIMRYVKDLYLVIFAVFWPWLVLKSGGETARIMLRVIFCEAILLLLGLIGHIVEFQPQLIIAGVRWLILLHAGIGLFCLVKAFNLSAYSAAKFVNKFVFIFVVISSAWAGIQWLLLAMPTLGGGYRFSGLYANAAVFSFAMVGASMYIMGAPFASRSFRVITVIIAFMGVILSGSRAAMLLESLFLFFIILSFKDNLKVKEGGGSISFLFMVIIVMVIAAVVLPQIESTADRGGILATQMIEGGRTELFMIFTEMVSKAPLVDVVFGKGFGYGTNNAATLGNEVVSYWYIFADNTFVTWFLQFGLLGTCLLLFGLIFFAIRLWLQTNNELNLQLHFYVISIALAVVFFVQNFFESYHFLLFFFLTCSFFSKKEEMY